MPLQVPGGPELLVIFLIAIVLFGIPLVLILVLGTVWLRSNRDEADVARRLAELQAEVRELRSELDGDDVSGGDGGSASDDADGSNDDADGPNDDADGPNDDANGPNDDANGPNDGDDRASDDAGGPNDGTDVV